MKGNEVTTKDMKRWDKQGYFPVACRLCGEIMLFPKESYKEAQLTGWECDGSLSVECLRIQRRYG